MALEYVQMLSRDHHDLFLFNSKTKVSRGCGQYASFLIYENVHLKMYLNDCLPEKHYICMAMVNWYECKIKVFENATSFDQNVCLYESSLNIISKKLYCSQKLFETLLYECFLYLKRAGLSIHSHDMKNHKDWITIQSLYSLTSTTARCPRLADLGYYNTANCSTYNNSPLWEKDKLKSCARTQKFGTISVMDIFKELGIYVPCNFRVPVVMIESFMLKDQHVFNLLDAFIKYGNFQFHLNNIRISSFWNNTIVNLEKIRISHSSCSRPENIYCMEDVIKSIKILDPEPFEWIIWDKNSTEGGKQVGSPEYFRKLKILREIDTSNSFKKIARKILVYETDNENKLDEKMKLICVFFPICEIKERVCNIVEADIDIKNIWKEAGIIIAGAKKDGMCKMANELGTHIQHILNCRKKTKISSIDASMFVPVNVHPKKKRTLMKKL
jgi:hypothetical protein